MPEKDGVIMRMILLRGDDDSDDHEQQNAHCDGVAVDSHHADDGHENGHDDHDENGGDGDG